MNTWLGKAFHRVTMADANSHPRSMNASVSAITPLVEREIVDRAQPTHTLAKIDKRMTFDEFEYYAETEKTPAIVAN